MTNQSDIQAQGNEKFAELQTTHPIVQTGSFDTIERYVLYLLHRKAYDHAAEIADGKSLLDWGCNDGYGIELMRPHVAQIAGLDSAEVSISAAHRRLPDLHANLRLYDGTRLPFPPGTFDVVTSFQVIEHVGDLKTYLTHILEALRPAGRAIFTTPNKNFRLDPGQERKKPFHVREFASSDLRELLACYFSAVQVLGNRAIPEMDSFERKRCLTAKRATKRDSDRAFPEYWHLRSTMINQLKGILPEPVSTLIRGFVRHRREQSAPKNLAKEVLDRFSTKDLFYTNTDLDDSLDLMAICTK